MKHEKIADSQVLRTGFYSCPEDCRELPLRYESDARHPAGYSMEISLPEKKIRTVRKKIRVIRKSLRKARRPKSKN